MWPCRLFAFATPTRRALRALRDASVSWVEVGAGLGYWAFAMKSAFGMDVVALDKTPGTEGSAVTHRPAMTGETRSKRRAK